MKGCWIELELKSTSNDLADVFLNQN